MPAVKPPVKTLSFLIPHGVISGLDWGRTCNGGLSLSEPTHVSPRPMCMVMGVWGVATLIGSLPILFVSSGLCHLSSHISEGFGSPGQSDVVAQ